MSDVGMAPKPRLGFESVEHFGYYCMHRACGLSLPEAQRRQQQMRVLIISRQFLRLLDTNMKLICQEMMQMGFELAPRFMFYLIKESLETPNINKAFIRLLGQEKNLTRCNFYVYLSFKDDEKKEEAICCMLKAIADFGVPVRLVLSKKSRQLVASQRAVKILRQSLETFDGIDAVAAHLCESPKTLKECAIYCEEYLAMVPVAKLLGIPTRSLVAENLKIADFATGKSLTPNPTLCELAVHTEVGDSGMPGFRRGVKAILAAQPNIKLLLHTSCQVTIMPQHPGPNREELLQQIQMTLPMFRTHLQEYARYFPNVMLKIYEIRCHTNAEEILDFFIKELNLEVEYIKKGRYRLKEHHDGAVLFIEFNSHSYLRSTTGF